MSERQLPGRPVRGWLVGWGWGATAARKDRRSNIEAGNKHPAAVRGTLRQWVGVLGLATVSLVPIAHPGVTRACEGNGYSLRKLNFAHFSSSGVKGKRNSFYHMQVLAMHDYLYPALNRPSRARCWVRGFVRTQMNAYYFALLLAAYTGSADAAALLHSTAVAPVIGGAAVALAAVANRVRKTASDRKAFLSVDWTPTAAEVGDDGCCKCAIAFYAQFEPYAVGHFS